MKEDYLKMSRIFLKALGVAIKQPSWLEELRGLIIWAFAIIILLMNIIGFAIALPEASITDQVTAVVAIIYSGATMVKFSFLQFKWRHGYEELIDFVDGWYLHDDPVSKMFKMMYEGTIFSSVTISVWYMMSPVIWWKQTLPIQPVKVPWDVQISIIGYLGAFFLQVLNIVLIVSLMIVTDYLIWLSCIAFRNRITKIGDAFKRLRSDEDLPILIDTLRRHQLILRKLKVLEVPCGPLFFIQVFTSFVGACFMLFSAIKQEVESTEAYIRIFAAAMATYTHLLLYCWVGQNITDASDSLQFAIYNNQWYECSPKMRETFHMIETFTCRSVQIQSSFVVKMSLKTFHKVMTESYSFLMVLMRLTNKGAVRDGPVIM